jgi:hypothetical protein
MIFQIKPENGFRYDDRGFLNGTVTLRRYRVPQIAIGMTVKRPTVLLIVRTAMLSPTKKRKRETWISQGTALATAGKGPTPSNRNCRIRAVFKGLLDRWNTPI